MKNLIQIISQRHSISNQHLKFQIRKKYKNLKENTRIKQLAERIETLVRKAFSPNPHDYKKRK